MSPLPPIAHILAVVVGVCGGFWAIGEIAPDLPSDDTEPGVAVADPGSVNSASSESLLTPAGLTGALGQLAEQLGDDEKITSMRIEPGRLQVERSTDQGLEPDQIPTSAVELIAAQIGEQRAHPLGAVDVASAELRPTPEGYRWFVELVATVDPPRSYVAVVPGPAPVQFQVKVEPRSSYADGGPEPTTSGGTR